MTEEWKKLTDKAKQKWEKAAEDDKKRYADECQEKGISAGKKKDAKDDDAPKKPLSGYMLFGKDYREKLAKSGKDVKAKDIMKNIGSEWNKLSDKEKDKWNTKAKEGKAEAQSATTTESKADKGKGKKKEEPAEEEEEAQDEEGEEEAEEE